MIRRTPVSLRSFKCFRKARSTRFVILGTLADVQDLPVAFDGDTSVDGQDLNKNIYESVETWRNRVIEGGTPYVYLDVHRHETQLGLQGAQRLISGGRSR